MDEPTADMESEPTAPKEHDKNGFLLPFLAGFSLFGAAPLFLAHLAF